MSRIIIFIFLGIGINFIMGCNGQLENRYISKAIYIDGSLVNKEFNKKILLELDDKNGILCEDNNVHGVLTCLLYTSPSPRDLSTSRMPSSA